MYYLMKDGCVVTLGKAKRGYGGVVYYPATGVGPFAWTENEEHFTYSATPDGAIPYKMKTPDIRTLKYFIDLQMHKAIAQYRACDTPMEELYQKSCTIQCCHCKRFECNEVPFIHNWVHNHETNQLWCPECYILRASDQAQCSYCGNHHIQKIVRNYEDAQIGDAVFVMYRFIRTGGDATTIVCEECLEKQSDVLYESDSFLDVDIVDAGHSGDIWMSDCI